MSPDRVSSSCPQCCPLVSGHFKCRQDKPFSLHESVCFPPGLSEQELMGRARAGLTLGERCRAKDAPEEGPGRAKKGEEPQGTGRGW